MSSLSPATAQFVLLSFEGPDRFSAAGGLAVRVRELSHALAHAGFEVHLYFVGDPDLEPLQLADGVWLHRWEQPLSNAFRNGVYDAQEEKIADLCVHLPPEIERLVRSGYADGRTTVVLAEEWQMVWPLVAIHEHLLAAGCRHRALLAWTANNKFGFDRVYWDVLGEAAAIFTISWFMKHLLWTEGVNPLVVPNGIPTRWLEVQAPQPIQRARASLGADVVLAKVGRWDPDKRWLMAIEAVARLRDSGQRAVLIARGWLGNAEASGHLAELHRHALSRRLRWDRLAVAGSERKDLEVALAAYGGDLPDILEITTHLPDQQLRQIYAMSDAVLANSGFEPFGLVGLEVMASRGIAITGSSGEDYVISFRNGFALDTDDPDEILLILEWLAAHPANAAAMRTAARETAKLYTWPHVIDRLLLALSYAARGQGVTWPRPGVTNAS